ncbi:MAG: M20/M25/M40 family metallo-hydrolase [Chitinophagaceae bacterium]|nr:M20/M25/M40 family metallo-hydrolase [Chitinophagaceae bacterium]
MRSSLTLALVCFAMLTCFAQDSAFIRKISDEMLRNGQAYENLRVLTKQIGGRLAGSPQMYKAESWAFELLQKSGADTVWKQSCRVPRWVRGGKDEMWSSEIVSSNNPSRPDARLIKVPYDVVALGNTIGTGPAGVSGELVMIRSFEELEKRKDEVKNKIVFYNVPFNPTYINTFLAYRDAGSYRTQGPARAARYGAKAVVVRSLTHAEDNHPHTGVTNYDTAYPRVPAVAVGIKDADKLALLLEKGKKVIVTMKTYGYFLPDTTGHNIIGELRGTRYPDEIITVGAHLDSWDNGEGAHDDGAGCVQTIEVLRTFKAIGYKPQRTIRFVLFANEENGLRGGNKYAEEAVNKKEKHIFALESDAGGFTPRSFGFTGSPEQYQKVAAWQKLLAPYGCAEITRGGGGADIGPLHRALNTPMAGLMPDSQRYFDVHHARSDVFEAVNKRELLLGAVNMAALIYLIDQYGL